MRRAFVKSLVVIVPVVVVPVAVVGCNVALGVDEPTFDPSISSGQSSGMIGSGGDGGKGGMASGSTSSTSSSSGMAGAGGGNCMPKETMCDGIDDDCNGQIDDLPLLTCGDGVCQVTAPACKDGMLQQCIPGMPTSEEKCEGDNNGIDDNCNGIVDEGCPCTTGAVEFCYTGAAGTRGVGACKDGTHTCSAMNEWGPCTGDTLPGLETCNAIDDDCNGTVDDGFGETVCGVGACEVKVPKCNPGGPPLDCVPKDPVPELCNGLDDNCDGTTDENNPQSAMDCMTGDPGPCAPGKTECVGGMLLCKPNVMAIPEVCNNIDDDCDGTIDNGGPGGGMMCPTGQLGECAKGITSCMGGALSCVPPLPMQDICDGLDNDCDGIPDNHGVGVGMACMTMLPGECSTGFTECKMGALNCAPSKIPTAETCDNKDNDCDGAIDNGNPGGGATCTYVGAKGACAVGTIKCQGGILTCTQTVFPLTETCDGVDNDCDGDVDEGPAITCGTCASPIIASAACATLANVTPPALVENCKQIFPAPANSSIPVMIPTPGTQYYVSPAGSDANDGTTPAKAWLTLCKAIAMVRPGNTIQVAEGTYVSTLANLAKGVTVKGGYKSDFTQWNPESFKSIFLGRLTLDHANAVWGGFRMITNPIASAQSQHTLKSGVFVRNDVEAVFATTVTAQSSALDTTSCAGATLTLLGNDVYAGATNATPLRAIGFNQQRGSLILESNRVCAEGKAIGSSGLAYAISGIGTDSADAGSMSLRNNLLETSNSGGYVVRVLGSSGTADFLTVMTNNTLLGRENGIGGSGANAAKMRWRLTNNIVFNLNSTGTGVLLGAGTGVDFSVAQYNLIFGFSVNPLANPAPVTPISNDTTNSATATSVFVNALTGDFRIKVAPGQADETGGNVYNAAAYGSVTTDLMQSPRPAAGAWDRGAIKN